MLADSTDVPRSKSWGTGLRVTGPPGILDVCVVDGHGALRPVVILPWTRLSRSPR